ncbi:MAG TPA: bifunctional glutamate N-acetyltransferase/amino-acid acetyltransferase ArgJ [Pseudoclavibacter sp.]|nr:bifunctional glutamate N-acetyltransferase/amino-acid acetyltransferase ArgJ [Pseudoclavibacter sp.]
MSVTAAKGFTAAGVSAGLKSTPGALDVAVVFNSGPRHDAAAVFTTNRCRANPVLWSEKVISNGRVDAVVLNSGGANCYTGDFGYETTALTAEAVANAAQVEQTDVFVCSTGLIGYGDQTFRDKVIGGARRAVEGLSPDGGSAAAEAILTTDTHAKTAIEHSPAGWTIGAMAKGAGMLAPGLATMLVVITTDAELEFTPLGVALREATSVTFDRLDSDGCMSTNDTVVLLSSGASHVVPDYREFVDRLTEVCLSLAKQLQSDAEGASHDIDIEVVHAVTEQEAVEVARSVARNNLFKTAIFGNDPNWGRVLAAIGTTSAEFDPYDVDVTINGVRVAHRGQPDAPGDTVDLTGREVTVQIDLKVGDAQATVMTNDLTHAYVHENSAYSS